MAEKINPYSKVAILMDAMGDDIASSVLKYLDPDDIRKLGVNIPKVDPPSPEVREAVLTDFIVRSSKGAYQQKQYLKSIYKKTLGMDPNMKTRATRSPKIAALEWINPKAIFDLISKEHPQTIALVLTYLTTEQSVSILTDLPSEIRVDVVLRMSTLDALPPVVIEETMETLSDALLDELEKMGIAPPEKAETVGGIKFVAELLKETDSAVAKSLMEKVMEASPETAGQIKELMFVFEDIAKFDDATMQTAMKEIPKDKLAIALRTGSQAVKDKIFRNMSQRAGQTLREDIEGRGAMKLSDVEAAQKTIVEVIRKMGDEGKISVGGKKSASDALV
ncbi:MAG: flagellar motor switch protein FliG [Nitrospirae bacterium]|nr:flagellar motor switch protein FliG [Candidatus Troglogloeales bacterium]MBI3598043.1 flagellar motor switch protein FliG [Candidatus Troglogloeales bacterium]